MLIKQRPQSESSPLLTSVRLGFSLLSVMGKLKQVAVTMTLMWYQWTSELLLLWDELGLVSWRIWSTVYKNVPWQPFFSFLFEFKLHLIANCIKENQGFFLVCRKKLMREEAMQVANEKAFQNSLAITAKAHGMVPWAGSQRQNLIIGAGIGVPAMVVQFHLATSIEHTAHRLPF